MLDMKRIKSKRSWNKSDLTVLLANEAQIPKVRAAQYINILTDTIAEALEAGKKVTISDFGTFNVSERRSFAGRNPKTGEPLRVPIRRIPVFRAGKKLKKALNIPQVKRCNLVNIQQVKVQFSKLMWSECGHLLDPTSYGVLVDQNDVGAISAVEIHTRSSISRKGEEVEGVSSVILHCEGALRGSSLNVVFHNPIEDIDGNVVQTFGTEEDSDSHD